MSLKKHKVPGHLEQPDHILFGLTARQTLLLACGVACAGMAWMNNTGSVAGTVLTLILMLGAMLGACAVAFLAPAGRGLEVWVFVCLTYVCLAKVYVWRLLDEIEDEDRGMLQAAAFAAAASIEEDN